MRNLALMVLLVLGGVVMTAPAKTKKKLSLPQLLCHARYIDVGSYMPLFRKLADAVDDSCPDATGGTQ